MAIPLSTNLTRSTTNGCPSVSRVNSCQSVMSRFGMVQINFLKCKIDIFNLGSQVGSVREPGGWRVSVPVGAPRSGLTAAPRRAMFGESDRSHLMSDETKPDAAEEKDNFKANLNAP